MYIFLKSIAAIIHFRALMPPYTREAFRPPYTPRSIYAFQEGPSYNPRFLFASHFDRLYMFLKSIAAIIHFRALLPPYNPTREAFRPPYTPGSFRLITLIKCLKGHKSLRTFCDGPETLTEWKSESVTDLHLTWVGARDTCVSKK